MVRLANAMAYPCLAVPALCCSLQYQAGRRQGAV